MAQTNTWKTRRFPNEVGSIGEKVGKKWLENKGYKVYFFQDIMGTFAYLQKTILRMNRRRKKEYKENDRKIIQEIEQHLMGIFGQRYEALKQFDKTIRQLAAKEKERRLAQGYKQRRALGFDYIATKNNSVSFIDVKVNQAELRKYQKLTSKIIKDHGFKAMVLRLNVKITIKNSIQIVEPPKIFGERNG